jgi:hypothetical protein
MLMPFLHHIICTHYPDKFPFYQIISSVIELKTLAIKTKNDV